MAAPMFQAGQDLKGKLSGLSGNYYGILDQAAENLGQVENRNAVSASRQRDRDDSVNSLINGFVDRTLAKTGQVPTEDQVRQFVNQTYTPGYANKFTLRQVNADTINGMVDSFLSENPVGESPKADPIESRILGLNDQLDKAYEGSRSRFLADADEIYGGQKTNLVNDLAGQGMLTQPNSRISLNTLEGNKQKTIGQGLTDLATRRAEGSIGLSSTIENLLANERRAKEEGSRFNKTFSANRDDVAFDQASKSREMSLAERLGKLQAGQKPGWGAGAAGGAISGASMGSAFGPWGALLGGAGGALLGGFTAK